MVCCSFARNQLLLLLLWSTEMDSLSVCLSVSVCCLLQTTKEANEWITQSLLLAPNDQLSLSPPLFAIVTISRPQLALLVSLQPNRKQLALACHVDCLDIHQQLADQSTATTDALLRAKLKSNISLG